MNIDDKISVSFVIIAYNSHNYLISCLKSIEDVIPEDLNYETIVFDNCSPERDIEKIQADFKDTKFIFNPVNLGFSKANNLCVEASKSTIICFLNPDTVVTQDFVSPIVKYIISAPKAGACGPMLLYKDNSYQPSTGFKMGFLSELFESLMFINIYRKIKAHVYLKKNFNKHPVAVGWVSAACLIIRRSAFEVAGGFSNEYFLNYEDIDLCKKLDDKGYRNYFFPNLKCIHFDHGSFAKNYELLVFSRYSSRLQYAKTHYSAIKRYSIRCINVFGIILRLALVNFIYSGEEKKQRMNGYIKSLKLYLNFIPYR